VGRRGEDRQEPGPISIFRTNQASFLSRAVFHQNKVLEGKN
jgi:hypothetical protein